MLSRKECSGWLMISHVQDRSNGSMHAKKSPPDPCMLPAANQERPGSCSPFFSPCLLDRSATAIHTCLWDRQVIRVCIWRGWCFLATLVGGLYKIRTQFKVTKEYLTQIHLSYHTHTENKIYVSMKAFSISEPSSWYSQHLSFLNIFKKLNQRGPFQPD